METFPRTELIGLRISKEEKAGLIELIQAKKITMTDLLRAAITLYIQREIAESRRE